MATLVFVFSKVTKKINKNKISVNKSTLKNYGAVRYYSNGNITSSVGFIGLGEMGYRMARNLMNSNKIDKLVLFDIREDVAQKLKSEQKGTNQVVIASSPSDVAEKSDTIITMLPEPKHVMDVYKDSTTNVFAKAKKGSILIDASTIDPITSRLLHTESQKRGLTMVDAPVSGGITGADAATLTFMVGSQNSDIFDKVSPLLKIMGKNIVNCGGAGNGQVAKVCNNLVLGISMIGVSEAMNLGARLGMDAATLAAVINTSSGRCWSSDTYNPVPGVNPNVPSSKGYNGGFGVDLMAKDLSLAVAAANSLKAPLPLGAEAHQFYNNLSNHGYGKKDFSVAYQYLQKKDPVK